MNSPKTLPEIVKVAIIKAPIEKVWKTVSTSDGLESWWMANTLLAEKGTEFILHSGPFGDSKCKVTEVAPLPLEFPLGPGMAADIQAQRN